MVSRGQCCDMYKHFMWVSISLLSNCVWLNERTSTIDQENDHMAIDSIVGERVLREIYLMPFMLARS